MNKSLTVIIPAYNEEKSLEIYLQEVIKFCEIEEYKLIIVNDGSKDKTKKIIESFLKHDCLKLVSHKVNRGYGGAIKSGIKAANTDYVITIDADGQHVLDDVKSIFIEAVEKDADMIIGSRKGSKSASVIRSIGKSLIRSIAKVLMPINIYDINSGMKLYNTDLAKKYISVCPDNMAYSDIIALTFINQRHLVLEKQININKRIAGVSTIGVSTAFDTVREILNIVILFNPMRVFLPLAIVFVFLGIIWQMYLFVFVHGVGGNDLSGFSTAAMLSIVTGIIFFVLGLMAEQLSDIRKNNINV